MNLSTLVNIKLSAHENGISAQEYLSKARAMFQEMDLQYDLDELEKIAASN